MAMLALLLGLAQATPVVTPATGVLDAALRLGVDTTDGFAIENGVRTPTSLVVRTVTRDGETYLIVVVHRSRRSEDVTVDSTRVAAGDLRLLRKAVWATTDSAVVAARGGRITGWAVPPGESRRVVDIAVADPVFPDDGLAPWLFTRLPLREGYAVRVESFNPWTATADTVTYRVTRVDTVERNGRRLAAWVVSSDRLAGWGLGSEAWVAQADRRVIQGRAWREDGAGEWWSVVR